MSSKESIPEWGPNDLSPEEARELFRDMDWSSAQVNIPEWHVEILKERIAHYCEFGMRGTPWEEFEKELLEQLMKG